MSIESILDRYVESSRAAQAQAAQSRSREQERQHANALVCEGVLTEMIGPLLHEAAAAIRARGFEAHAESVLRPAGAGLPQSVMSVRLAARANSTDRVPLFQDSWLSFDSRADAAVIGAVRFVEIKRGAPEKAAPLPAADWTSGQVRTAIEAFMDAVFATPPPPAARQTP